MTFENLNIIAPILQALASKGYTDPTPIQEKVIPHMLNGSDVFGTAQTGTGKTAAFAIPILQNLYMRPINRKPSPVRALIMAPTRELVQQISDSFTDYGKGLGLKHTFIYGGVSQHSQTEVLRRGVDILIATPGRLLDLVNQKFINLSGIEYFILDEADHMLDMGFLHDIKRVIAKLPARRQTGFFTATVPVEIRALADSLLTNPVKVNVAPISAPAHSVNQSVYFVEKNDKSAMLREIFRNESIETALIFTRTKHGADRVTKDLVRQGIPAVAIHGNKSQVNRQKALNGFKARTVRVLVATDIASRGIDVDKISHVINYELPEVPETYIHRIGRTARAGESGIAISFCSTEERGSLKGINRLLPRDIKEKKMQGFVLSPFVPSSEILKPRNGYAGRKPARQQTRTNNAQPSFSRQKRAS
jgi:ATP-dependent RNA helicase RhlE